MTHKLQKLLLLLLWWHHLMSPTAPMLFVLLCATHRVLSDSFEGVSRCGPFKVWCTQLCLTWHSVVVNRPSREPKHEPPSLSVLVCFVLVSCMSSGPAYPLSWREGGSGCWHHGCPFSPRTLSVRSRLWVFLWSILTACLLDTLFPRDIRHKTRSAVPGPESCSVSLLDQTAIWASPELPNAKDLC